MDTCSSTNSLDGVVPQARPVVALPIKPVGNDQWGLGSAIKILLLVWAAEIGISVVFGFVAGFASAVVNPGIAADSEQFEQDILAIIMGPSVVAGQLLGFWIVYCEVTRRRKLSFLEALRLNQWRTGRLVAFGILGLVLSWFSCLLSLFVPPPTEQPFDELLVIAESGSGGIIMLFTIFLLAPFVEEILFRGYLYAGFKRRLGVVGGWLLISIIFVGMHLFTLGFYWPAILAISVLSLSLVGIREWTGSLSNCILFHLGFNLLPTFGLLVA